MSSSTGCMAIAPARIPASTQLPVSCQSRKRSLMQPVDNHLTDIGTGIATGEPLTVTEEHDSDDDWVAEFLGQSSGDEDWPDPPASIPKSCSHPSAWPRLPPASSGLPEESPQVDDEERRLTDVTSRTASPEPGTSLPEKGVGEDPSLPAITILRSELHQAVEQLTTAACARDVLESKVADMEDIIFGLKCQLASVTQENKNLKNGASAGLGEADMVQERVPDSNPRVFAWNRKLLAEGLALLRDGIKQAEATRTTARELQRQLDACRSERDEAKSEAQSWQMRYEIMRTISQSTQEDKSGDETVSTASQGPCVAVISQEQCTSMAPAMPSTDALDAATHEPPCPNDWTPLRSRSLLTDSVQPPPQQDLSAIVEASQPNTPLLRPACRRSSVKRKRFLKKTDLQYDPKYSAVEIACVDVPLWFDKQANDYICRNISRSHWVTAQWLDPSGMTEHDMRGRRLRLAMDHASIDPKNDNGVVWRAPFDCNGLCLQTPSDVTRRRRRKDEASPAQEQTIAAEEAPSKRQRLACDAQIEVSVAQARSGLCTVWHRDHHQAPDPSIRVRLSPFVRNKLHEAASVPGATASGLRSWYYDDFEVNSDHIRRLRVAGYRSGRVPNKDDGDIVFHNALLIARRRANRGV